MMRRIVCTFAVVAFTAWLGTRIGKRHAFFVATGLSMIGYALKWICYDPAHPMLVILPAPLLAFGLGALFEATGNLVAPIVAHALINLVNLRLLSRRWRDPGDAGASLG